MPSAFMLNGIELKVEALIWSGLVWSEPGAEGGTQSPLLNSLH